MTSEDILSLGDPVKVPLTKSLGKQIKYLRKQQGLSQTQLATLVGTSTAHVPSIENGNAEGPRIATFERFAEALACKLSVKLEKK